MTGHMCNWALHMFKRGHPEEALRYLGPELAAGYPDEKGALHAQLANTLRKTGTRRRSQACFC